MKIRQIIYIGILAFSIIGCAAQSELVQHEKEYGPVCDCITSTEKPNIDLLLSLCLPTSFDRNDMENYVLKEIKQCESLFNTMLNRRDEYIMKVANKNAEKLNPTETNSGNSELIWRQSDNLLNNHLDSVLIYSDKILKTEPENIEVLLLKGYALETSNKYGKALKVYQKLQKLNGDQFYKVNLELIKTKMKSK